MSPAAHLAQHVRAVFFGGNWTEVNLRATLVGVTWQQATTRVGTLNTIAALVYHLGFYVSTQLRVLQGGPLTGHDRDSFAHPPITSPADWEAQLTNLWTEAEALARLIERLPEPQLWQTFGDEKYGTYYRNLHGAIEHAHYHLGQIVLVKKMLSQTGSRKPIIKWNGELNFGNVLTTVTIIIAVIGLWYQKKSVDTKVDDLQAVVQRLEKETSERELQGAEQNLGTLNSFNYTLGYTVSQLTATEQLASYEAIFMMREINDLIDLRLKQAGLSPAERRMLETIKSRNINKSEVYGHAYMFRSKMSEFEKANEPKKGDYSDDESFLTAKTRYNDTLSKHTNYLLHLQDSFSREPNKMLKKLENEYMTLRTQVE